MNIYTPLALTKEPFSTSPDPSFFYHSPGHLNAKIRLEINIRLRRGLTLLLGDIGTGKTTLWRSLVTSFHRERDYIFHVILDPQFATDEDFISYLARLFNMSAPFASLQEAKEAIVHYLYRKAADEQKTVILIIDEGQKLTAGQLEILRVLLNYETNEFKMLQLVILSQLEILPVVRRMPNFVDRIVDTCLLEPLSEFETGEMIRFRLKQAGYHSRHDLFDRAAVRRIHRHTKGYPRQIARICHRVMEYVLTNRCDVVSSALINGIIDRDKIWGQHAIRRNF